ncbi:hypothetical protein OIU79_021521 [Salix purpurea]|uniref:Uncharacterized protein n=1 Tax=Salix purpurea TaxID=77065 RepID=A0A9Q0WDM9_SALPP|nr:hypothetical protein OIU79_021521 [Salix purpurea]
MLLPLVPYTDEKGIKKGRTCQRIIDSCALRCFCSFLYAVKSTRFTADWFNMKEIDVKAVNSRNSHLMMVGCS